MDDDDLVPNPHDADSPGRNKLPNPNKKPYKDLKFDFEAGRGLNPDLQLLPPPSRQTDPDVPLCKPDGMLVGQNNPFFTEERYRKKNLPPNVKYDVIGPYGTEVNPDLETYPFHTSKKKDDDFPGFNPNNPNFNPGNPGGFGNFPKFF